MTPERSTNIQLLHIAFPMLLVGLSTPLLGMVDTAVVGHLSHPSYLGAVALGSMIFNFLFWGVGFLRMSSTALTARALGQDSEQEILLVLIRGFFVAFLIGCLFIVLQQLIASIVFSMIESSIQVITSAKEYFNIRIWAAPATLANYVLLGWFLGQGRAKVNLLLVVSGNLLNVVLDIVFVVNFNMNVAGVAWATVIAEYCVLLTGVYLISRTVPLRKLNFPWKLIIETAAIRHYLKFNRDIFLRTLFLIMCFSYFTISGAKYGEVILAANAVLMNLQIFLAHVLDSIAHAIEVLVGKNYFKAKQKQLNLFLRTSLLWSVIVAITFSIVYFFAGYLIAGLLTDINDVLGAVETYLPWIILSPLVSVWSYWFDGIFIGANLAKYMRNTMLFSMLVFFSVYVVFSYWGNHGLWAALMSFMFARGASMAYVTWRKHLFQPRV